MTNKIEWTDETWNPIVGCSKVSDGCKNCYALPMAYRLMNNPKTADIYAGTAKREGGKTTWTGRLNLNEKALMAPLKWKKPRKIFVNSMSDLFHEDVRDEWIDRVFAVMALCPQHTFQILTKRPERMQEYLSEIKHGDRDNLFDVVYSIAEIHLAIPDGFDPCPNIKQPLPNVWWGTSIEDQKTANERIPHLLETPASVRWVSAEPLLGEWMPFLTAGYGKLGTSNYNCLNGERRLDWVVVGGESGHGARPMHPDWVKNIQRQCETAHVPFLFKQWGDWLPHSQFNDAGVPDDDEITRYNTMEWKCDSWKDVGKPVWSDFRDGVVDEDECCGRVGKKAAGRKLNGKTYDEYPEVTNEKHEK